MKNLSLLLLALFLTTSLHTQITITSADMPQTNEPYPRSTGNVADFFDLTDGENYFWDYSALTSTGYDTIVYVSVSDAPFSYQLLFNNIFIEEYYADHARHVDDFEIPTIATFTDNYEFYQNNSADYRKLGQGSNINGFPTVSQNDPIDIIYRFPMAYGNIDSSYTELEMQVPGLLFFHQEINRHNYVDGWGTLALPLGTYDVLRVRTEIFEVDSVHIQVPFEFGMSIPLPDRVEYKWFTQGEGEPILNITEAGGVVANVSFLDSIAPEPIDTTVIDSTNISVDELRLKTIKMYPNPAQHELTLTGLDYQGATSISIVDLQGKIIHRFDDIHNDVYVINTSYLSPGQYIVRLSSNHVIEHRSLIITE